MKFYNVKTRSSVEIDEKDIKKVKYTRKTANGDQFRYAIRTQFTNPDGTKINLTKFVSKTDWDALDVPVEETK
jgi:hypothetical protein